MPGFLFTPSVLTAGVKRYGELILCRRVPIAPSSGTYRRTYGRFRQILNVPQSGRESGMWSEVDVFQTTREPEPVYGDTPIMAFCCDDPDPTASVLMLAALFLACWCGGDGVFHSVKHYHSSFHVECFFQGGYISEDIGYEYIFMMQ